MDVLGAVRDQDTGVLRQALVGGEPHAHHSGVGQLHGLERLRSLRGDVLEQQRRSGRGNGEDHAVVDRILTAGEAVAVAVALNAGDKRVDVDVGARALRKRLVKLLVAVAEGLEHRPLARGHLPAGALQVGHCGRQVHRAVALARQTVELLRQLRDGRAHTEVVRGTRVHPTQQGGDDGIRHLVAVALPDERADVDVAADVPREALAAGLGVDTLGGFGADQVPHRLGGRRDTHHAPCREVTCLAVHPHQRPQPGRFHQGVGQPQLGEEVHRVLAARQEGLRAHVGGAAFKGDGVELAADTVGSFVDVDLQLRIRAELPQLICGGQTR